MTTHADMSVVRRMLTCYVHSSCMNAIAYGGGSGYAIWRGEILLRAGAAPWCHKRSHAHGTGLTECFRDVVQSRLGRYQHRNTSRVKRNRAAAASRETGANH